MTPTERKEKQEEIQRRYKVVSFRRRLSEVEKRRAAITARIIKDASNWEKE